MAAQPIDRQGGTGAPAVITRYLCPVDGCDWFFQIGVNLCVRYVDPLQEYLRLTQEAEDSIKDHLETHTVLEWTTTIARLQNELAEARPTQFLDD